MTKIVYWVSTGLVSVIYLAGAAFYTLQMETVIGLYAGLGYPAYLVYVLIVAKLAGAAAILWRRPVWLADLAYSGMFYHLLLAASAHINAGDGGFAPALVALVALLVSFFTQNAARKGMSPYAGTRFGKA